jgi:hypothetical protein
VYTRGAHDLSPESAAVMRAELQRLLSPSAFDVAWRNASDRKAGEAFDIVTVASFEGSCSTLQPVLTPATISLADTSISEGRILPFFRVDCARIVQLLGPHAQPALVGQALARVIAHELYHIVTRTAEHHDTGVAKAIFSSRDLTNPRLEFDPWTLARMRPAEAAAAERISSDAAR